MRSTGRRGAQLQKTQNILRVGVNKKSGSTIRSRHFCVVSESRRQVPRQCVGAFLCGNAKFHAFLWTRETGMQDLGTVGSDPNSIAIGINDAGQIVGSSIDAKFNPRAFLRVGQDLIDLNELVPTDSPLYLFTACSINAAAKSSA